MKEEWRTIKGTNDKYSVSNRNISFEKEAYDNEKDLTYLNRRKHYGMWR